MEQLITRTIEAFVFPPGVIFLALLLGMLLSNSRPLLAKSLLWISLLGGYLLSTPLVANVLVSQLQIYPALTEQQIDDAKAGAIVVLASGRYRNAPEYGEDTVGTGTLVRIRYGAYLQRKTNLPILVSGGVVLDKDGKTLAQVMADSLKRDFNAGEVWLEDKSRTTGENAIFSQSYLEERGIDTIYLVTHAWHMPRSVDIFEQVGMKVIPAPTIFVTPGGVEFFDLLPSTKALRKTRYALHEMVGMLWYKLRY